MKKLFVGMVVCCVLLITVSYGHAACEGDVNCSGGVDGSDLAAFAADYGTAGCGNCDDVASEIDDLKSRIAQLEALLAGVTRSVDGNTIIWLSIKLK